MVCCCALRLRGACVRLRAAVGAHRDEVLVAVLRFRGERVDGAVLRIMRITMVVHDMYIRNRVVKKTDTLGESGLCYLPLPLVFPSEIRPEPGTG